MDKQYEQEEEMLGDELLAQGFCSSGVDAFGEKIELMTTYIVKKSYDRGVHSALTPGKWKLLEVATLAKDIQNQKGMISWANFGCRLGFFDSPLDCVESMEENILTLAEGELFDWANYLKKELEELKEYCDEV